MARYDRHPVCTTEEDKCAIPNWRCRQRWLWMYNPPRIGGLGRWAPRRRGRDVGVGCWAPRRPTVQWRRRFVRINSRRHATRFDPDRSKKMVNAWPGRWIDSNKLVISELCEVLEPLRRIQVEKLSSESRGILSCQRM